VHGSLVSVADEYMGYMDRHRLHVLLLSDSGRDCVGLEESFAPRRVFSTGVGPNGRSCAIVLDPSLLLCGHVLRDPSGGAIAVDVVSRDSVGKSTTVRLIAVYQPQGLDGLGHTTLKEDPPVGVLGSRVSGALTGRAKMDEAHRVRLVVRDWSRCPGVRLAVLGGDLNETVAGGADRSIGPTGTRRGRQLFGCVHHMLLNDGWSDLYRDVHPVGDDGVEDVDVNGHTYHGCGVTGSSRITYMLTHPRLPLSPVLLCDVDHTLFLGGPGGHRPLVWSVPCGRPEVVGPGGRPCLGASIRTAGLSDVQRAELRASVDVGLGLSAERWCRVLDSIQANTDANSKLFDTVSRELVEVIFESCSGITSSRRAGPGKRHRPSPPLVRAKSIRRQLCRLRRALSTVFGPGLEPVTVFSQEAAMARHELRRWGAGSLLGQCDTARWGDVGAWRALLDGFGVVLRCVRNEIRSIVREDSNHPSNLRRVLFQTAKGRGKFYRRQADNCGGLVSSARDRLGEIQTRPEVYKPIVRAKVAAPFSCPRSGPAVPAWRSLSSEERTTGVPFWWHHAYRWRAKGIDPATWSPLVRAIDRRGIYDVIVSTDSGKSPGHDGISMDLLRLLVGPTFRCCPLLDVLVSLVNATIRTGIVPDRHVLGEIVLIPKPGSSSVDPSDMRPITLLSELGKLVSRVMAGRLTRIVHDNPSILDEAQRANLHDGNCRQCLSTSHNVCEDFLERFRSDPDCELVFTAYDVRKAFDSVQGFTLQATCDRFSLPPVFALILLRSLSGATSCVRTQDGLTEPIPILTSVRQGDPLAAIAFVLVMDALHAGFKRNPLALGSSPPAGYALADGPTVFSCGYADDTSHVNGSWAATRIQHMWVLDFFTAHHLRLNSGKSYCVVGSGVGLSAGVLSVADACATVSVGAARAADLADDVVLSALTGGLPYVRSLARLRSAVRLLDGAMLAADPKDPGSFYGGLASALAKSQSAAASAGEAMRALVGRGAVLTSGSVQWLRTCAADVAVAVRALRLRCAHLRTLPDIDESRVHDPASGRPAPAHMLSYPYPLVSLDIVTHSSAYAFRYLGYMFRMDLRADDMVGVLSGRVWAAARRIVSDRLSLVEASDFLREYVYPRLELGLLFAAVPRSALSGWDSLVARAVLRARAVPCPAPCVSSVAHSALYLALGVPPLSEHALVVAGTELGLSLRDLPMSMHSLTTRCRLRAAIRTGHLATSGRQVRGEWWNVVTSVRSCRTNRVARVLCLLGKAGVRVSFPQVLPHRRDFTFAAVPPVDPRVGCPVLASGLSSISSYRVCPPAPGGCLPVSAFTDGAYGRGGGGYASVLCSDIALRSALFDFGPDTCLVLQGASPPSGASYTAEAAAVLVTLCSVPVNCPLTVYTDSLSAMQAIDRGLLPASRRVRLGARAFIVLCRSLVAIRWDHEASTTFVHVHSHTEGTDVGSRGNAAADVSAGAARGMGDVPVDPFLMGEEDFVFWDNDFHVSGDLGSLLKRKAMSSQLRHLCSLRTQGAVAREARSRLTEQFDLVRKTRSSGDLLFLLLAATRQTHTADRLVFPLSARTADSLLCRRCGRAGQSADHVFACSSVRPHLRMVRLQASELSLSVAAPLLGSLRVTDAAKSGVRSVCASADWCDPALDLGELSGYAGLLGMLSRDLVRLLCPPPASVGVRERVQKHVRAAAEVGLRLLRLRTLQAARRVYEVWCGHPVDRWSKPRVVSARVRPVWDPVGRLWSWGRGRPGSRSGGQVLTSSSFPVGRRAAGAS